jgi:hypothetical protein
MAPPTGFTKQDALRRESIYERVANTRTARSGALTSTGLFSFSYLLRMLVMTVVIVVVRSVSVTGAGIAAKLVVLGDLFCSED